MKKGLFWKTIGLVLAGIMVLFFLPAQVTFAEEREEYEGWKIARHVYNQDNGYPWYIYEYEYDLYGNLIKKVCDTRAMIAGIEWDGTNIDSPGLDYEEEYDAYGNLIKKKLWAINSSWYILDVYDATGKVVTSTGYTADDSVMYYSKYVYDANGNLIKQISYNSDGIVSGRDEYVYDANGDLKKST